MVFFVNIVHGNIAKAWQIRPLEGICHAFLIKLCPMSCSVLCNLLS